MRRRLSAVPATRYSLIALDDIAWLACHMFGNWQSWGACDLAVIGDSSTGDEIAAAFTRRLHPALMTFEDWLRQTGWTG